MQLVKSVLKSCRAKNVKTRSVSNGFTQGGLSEYIQLTKKCECLRKTVVTNGWTEGGYTSYAAVDYELCRDLMPEASYDKILELNL